ncbi:hypothetical protein L218DRAFT_943359 [Marasmius fiardii PR-910]|nr:hypothetical protein L218DRAFT_943359 [Marasmius fiardii PR-910]
MPNPAALKESVMESVEVMVYHQRTVAYMDVIATMVLLYEIFLNLPSEIDHIWMRKWSYLTVIYIFQRYLPLFDTAGFIIHHNFGANLTPRVWCFIVGMLASEIILTLRVWAVWGRRNSVAIGFIFFLLACWAPNFLLSAKYLQAVRFTTHHPLQGCFITNASQLLYLRWVLLLVYDTGTLVMILIPVIAAYREGGRSSLLKTVYRDVVPVTSVINVVLVRTLPLSVRHAPNLNGRPTAIDSNVWYTPSWRVVRSSTFVK